MKSEQYTHVFSGKMEACVLKPLSERRFLYQAIPNDCACGYVCGNANDGNAIDASGTDENETLYGCGDGGVFWTCYENCYAI
jgi:hypothetical protein